MQFTGNAEEFLLVDTISKKEDYIIQNAIPSSLTILWFTANDNLLEVDSIKYQFKKNQIVCLTEFHKVEILNLSSARVIRFNRPFYCILDHDIEIGCKGLLFFGASNLPIINLAEADLETFESVYNLLLMELKTSDNLQMEMLQMMLKRFLILCTRLYKSQENFPNVNQEQQEIIRTYNFLVEKHYKTKHTVGEYAELLHKSPKTLSNIFSKIAQKTPLQFIQDRKILEARRLLRYSNKSIKEIGYEIGFEDIQSFGRFFKTKEGLSPSQYRATVIQE